MCGLTTDTLWLENNALRLGFDATNGALLAFTDRATRDEFAGAAGARDIWRLDRLTPGGSAVSSSSARSFSWHRLEGALPGVALIWSDFGLTQAPALRVTVEVRLLGDSAMTEWRIAVDGAGTLRIAQARFPRLAIPPRAGEELAVPRWMGAL